MKVLITGAAGMLGRTLSRKLKGHEVFPVDVEDFDITVLKDVLAAFRDLRPDGVIHCAAMTAVDDCEGKREEAFRLNAVGTANLALASQEISAHLLAISTDYVFSGDLSRPYNEWDEPAPRTVYGESKLAAEQAVRNHCSKHSILRIAWLYGQGGPSFYHSMVKLGALSGEALRVVSDQWGNPTSADSLVPVIEGILEKGCVGTFHCTCEGEANWYEFAREIFRLHRFARDIVACTSEEFPRPAARPRNSRLDNMALRLNALPPMPDWRSALSSFIEEYRDD